jgi:hypothetical protein
MKLNKLNDEEKTTIYAMGMLDNMVEEGWIEGPILLTKKGKKFFIKLLNADWNPDAGKLFGILLEIITGIENGDLFEGVDDE